MVSLSIDYPKSESNHVDFTVSTNGPEEDFAAGARAAYEAFWSSAHLQMSDLSTSVLERPISRRPLSRAKAIRATLVFATGGKPKSVSAPTLVS